MELNDIKRSIEERSGHYTCHFSNCIKTELEDSNLIDYFFCEEHMTEGVLE